MCGIAGYTGNTIPGLLEKMNNSMIHRGPDDEGYYSADDFHMSMRRLSIIDLKHGKQPMIHENIVVVFNGEIYNYLELRKELISKNHKLKTKSDTEVIAFLFKEHGINFIDKLNGMFAICILDKDSKDLYLIRDKIGEKPLYYQYDDQSKIFRFASEFNTLKNELDEQTINSNSLVWYFSQKTTPVESTILNEIKVLEPGTYLHYNKYKTIDLVKYYSVAKKITKTEKKSTEVQEELKDLLLNSVKIRMRSDVPIGTFLSGGIDSSLITVIASKESNKPLKTFSLVYDEEINLKSADKKYSRLISSQLKTNHTEVLLKPEMIIDELPNITKQFGQPNSAVISNWFISKEMSKTIKVALSGDGADELFGSYFLHRFFGAIAAYKETGKYDQSVTESDYEKKFFLENLDLPFEQIIDNFSIFSNKELKKLLNSEYFPDIDILSVFKKKKENLFSKDNLNQMLEFDSNNLLVSQILNYTDMLGMAHSLEIRVPFLDYRIIDYAFSLDYKFKILNGETKNILKKIAEEYLPKEIIDRKKEGFTEPNIYWLKDKLKDFCLSNLKSRTFNSLNFVNKDYVMKIIEDFYSTNDFFTGKKVWNLLMYSLWEKNYVGQ